MQLPDNFDARTVQPQQGVGGHPPGMFPFTITNTYLKDNQAKTGAMLVVELTSDVGKIENRYNVINPSPQAMEIAQKELSALCHAVGIFNVAFPKMPDGTPNYQMAGHTLRGGRGRMEVAPQTDREGKPNGYVEVKKVFDVNGNEPGKANMSQPQPQQQSNWGSQQPQQQQPQQQQANNGWANQSPPQQPSQQPNSGWAQGPNMQQPQQQQPQNNGAPPWATK